MRPDRFPKVNDVMLAEAMRQILPLAEKAGREIGERWAIGPVQRAAITLDMWVRQERGRADKLDGPLPKAPAGFGNVADNPAHPDPGQTVPLECQRRKRKPAGKKPGVS